MVKKKRAALFRGASMLLRRYFDHRVARDSAALTYYLLFAIFPLLVFFSNLVGLFAVDLRAALHELSAVIPVEVVGLAEQYLADISAQSSRTMLSFSLVFSIYFPMRAVSQLFLSMRKAYGMGRPKHVLRHWIKVLLYTLCFLLALVLSLLLATVGDRILRFVSDYIYLSETFIALWNSLRFALLGLIAFIVLAALYAFLQEDRHIIFHVWPGVLASLAAWLALSLLFSLYVENIGRYSVLYGSIATIIVLLLWLNLTASALIMGAEFNAVYRELHEEK